MAINTIQYNDEATKSFLTQAQLTAGVENVVGVDSSGNLIGADGEVLSVTGGGGGFTSIAFTTALPFTGNYEMPQTAVTGALAFTATGSTVGSQVNLCLVANGTNVPTFASNFKEATGSSGYDNTANVKNYFQFLYTNNRVIYSIYQEVGDTGAADITAPTLSSAVVQNATPTVVAVTYSEALDQTVAQNAADWAVSGHTVSSVAFASSTVINLTVDTFVYGEATRTVTYTNNANRVKDLAGNAALTSSATNITNNLAAPDVTAPTLTSATVENATPTKLTLVFSEALDQTKTLSASDFTLSGGKTDSSPVYDNSTTVSMTVTAFTNGEAITLDVAAGAVRDVAGNNLAAITARAITNNVAGAGAGDADADAFISAAGITDSTQQSAIQTLVTSLKTNSLWTKMQAIYPMVGGSAASHKWNLKDPRDLAAAFRLGFNGTLTHSASGVQGDGSTGYAETFFNGSTNLASASDAHLSFYQLENDTAGTSNTKLGLANGSTLDNGFYIAWHGTGTTLSGGIGNQFADVTNTAGYSTGITRGHYVVTRNGDTTQRLYNNATLNGTTATAVGSVSNTTVNLLAKGSATTRNIFSNKTCAFASIGLGLSATDVTNLYNAVQAFQTTLGRQV